MQNEQSKYINSLLQTASLIVDTINAFLVDLHGYFPELVKGARFIIIHTD